MRNNSVDNQSDDFQTRTTFVNLEKKPETPSKEAVKPILLGLFLIFFSIIGVSRITVVGQVIDDIIIGFLFGWFKFFIYILLVIISISLFLGVRFRIRKRFIWMSISTFIMCCWCITSIVIIFEKVSKPDCKINYFSSSMITDIFQAYIDSWIDNIFCNKNFYHSWYSINGNYIMPFAGGGAVGALLSGIVSYTSIIGNIILSIFFTFINFCWILTGDGFFLFKKKSKRKGGRIRILALKKNKELKPDKVELKNSGTFVEKYDISQDFTNVDLIDDLIYPSRKNYDLTIQVPNYFYQPREKKLDVTIDPELIAQNDLNQTPLSQGFKPNNLETYNKQIFQIGDAAYTSPWRSSESPVFENTNIYRQNPNLFDYGENNKLFPTDLNKFNSQDRQQHQHLPKNLPPYVEPQVKHNEPIYNYQQTPQPPMPQFIPSRKKVQTSIDDFNNFSQPISSREEIGENIKIRPFGLNQPKTNEKNTTIEYVDYTSPKTVTDFLAEKTADLSIISLPSDSPVYKASNMQQTNNEKIVKANQLEDFIKEKEYDTTVNETIPSDHGNHLKLSDIKNKYQLHDAKQNEEPKLKNGKEYNIVQNYEIPPTNLLDQVIIDQKDIDKANKFAQEQANAVNGVFNKFQVDAKVTRALTGPSVVKLEVSIGPKSSVKNITKIDSELKFALKTSNIIIEAPIEGKEAVGIEFASQSSIPVSFREAVEKIPAHKVSSKLVFPIGKNVSNEWIFAKLEEMPHLLIAGSTGSGKSVMVNSIICTLLMRVKPHEVKLLLIDPKKVELAYYDKIPHLLTPVISDMTLAGNALKKAVEEMERRYDLFNEKNVKQIEQYNKLTTERKKKLPYIVIVIDELADLMLSPNKKEVESSIQRLTQMARACGIHLIVATQRPSVDVITGVIKSNIPSRIAFAVASSVDSRTILDSVGGESLNGKGDMLFSITGHSGVNRAQGCYIKDHEIQSVVDYVKSQAEPIYDEDFISITAPQSSAGLGGRSASEKVATDPLLQDIIEYMIKKGETSTSDIQRRFAIGYNRAANFMQQFEDDGLIGPVGSGSNQKRKVYIKE